MSSTSQDYTLAIDDLKAMWHRTLFRVWMVADTEVICAMPWPRAG